MKLFSIGLCVLLAMLVGCGKCKKTSAISAGKNQQIRENFEKVDLLVISAKQQSIHLAGQTAEVVSEMQSAGDGLIKYSWICNYNYLGEAELIKIKFFSEQKNKEISSIYNTKNKYGFSFFRIEDKPQQIGYSLDLPMEIIDK